MRGLYKYPQQEYPYSDLLRENGRRTRSDPEYELLDTGIFKDNRYWDVEVEYAKESANDLLIKVNISNRAETAETIHFLPTFWVIT